MKKVTFTGLAFCLLIAAEAPQQRALHLKGQHAGKGETMADSDVEAEVVGTVDLSMQDPSGLSDEDAIRLIRSFDATPWDSPGSREALVLSVDTAEGQLYLACLYARRFFPLGPAYVHPAKVVECCQRALALKPGYAEAYIVMAQGLRALRRYKDAESALRSAIALRPNWASSYCQLAYVLEDQGRYSDSLAASQQEDRLSQQDTIKGSGTGYWGPFSLHGKENDALRLDQIQFKIERPKDVWLPNERIRALRLNHDPIGWLNPLNNPK